MNLLPLKVLLRYTCTYMSFTNSVLIHNPLVLLDRTIVLLFISFHSKYEVIVSMLVLLLMLLLIVIHFVQWWIFTCTCRL